MLTAMAEAVGQNALPASRSLGNCCGQRHLDSSRGGIEIAQEAFRVEPRDGLERRLLNRLRLSFADGAISVAGSHQVTDPLYRQAYKQSGKSVSQERLPGGGAERVPRNARVDPSRDLKRRGFNFVGSTICYAFMQAVGMVNDHLLTCFRHGCSGRDSRG